MSCCANDDDDEMELSNSIINSIFSRKCKFTAELQGKYKCFKKGRSDEEAEEIKCQINNQDN